jgi:hypothetical protein
VLPFGPALASPFNFAIPLALIVGLFAALYGVSQAACCCVDLLFRANLLAGRVREGLVAASR